MKQHAQRICRAGILACLFVFQLTAQGQSATQDRQAGMPAPLTEIEQLKGENLVLKLDSIDKQMRLMQAQFQQLQEQL